MQAPQDYFSLFSLERRFAIDKKALSARFRDLQSESHPDKVAAADEQRNCSPYSRAVSSTTLTRH